MTLSTYPEKKRSVIYIWSDCTVGSAEPPTSLALTLRLSVAKSLLERTIQLPLLEKRGRNVVLTEAGRLLADDYAITQQNAMNLSGNSAICAICVEGQLRCALDKGWSRNHYPRRERFCPNLPECVCRYHFWQHGNVDGTHCKR